MRVALRCYEAENRGATASRADGHLQATQRDGAVPEPSQRSIRPAAVLRGAHQSGVNALAAAPLGRGRVLVLSGGDDQALHAALLGFETDPAEALAAAPADPSPSQGDPAVMAEDKVAKEPDALGEGGLGDDARSHQQPLEQPRAHTEVAPDGAAALGVEGALRFTSDGGPVAASGLRGHAAAIAAQSRPAVLQCLTGRNASVAIAGFTAGATQGTVSVRLLGSCRVANAHASAVRGVWTDGRHAVTVGLDQRVRLWGFEVQHSAQQPPAACGETGNSNDGFSMQEDQPESCGAEHPLSEPHDPRETMPGGPGGVPDRDHVTLELSEQASVYTQVLEPEDMTVLLQSQTAGESRNGGMSCHDVLTIAVVGRGTEVLVYDLEHRTFLT